MISIKNISKTYQTTTVLQLEELQIPKGECFGLIGNNGAGKTTLFSLILDLIQPTTGEISIAGINVAESEDWKPLTSSFLDDSFLISYLKPEEYFYFIGSLRDWNKQTVDEFLLNFTDLFNDEIIGRNRFIRDLSKGNAKKVGIVGALIGYPELVILDEPFANLDPRTQIRLKQILREYKENHNTTLVISSHDLLHTVEMSDRIVLLDKGLLIKDTPTTENTLQELQQYFGA